MQEIATPNSSNRSHLSIDDIYKIIGEDLELVNQLIKNRLHSDVALINQLSHYIIYSGGKRLRPVLVLLSARALDYPGSHHINLAAIVEFIHTATLLHDDVVDASNKRRGKDTANALWGNETAVLVGDFLYSRAFQMMVDSHSMRVMEILSDATNTIAEGEVLQLLNCHDPETSEKRYMDVIHFKTAKLFEAAAQLGAVISHARPELEFALAKYGMYLGTAFQLVDDVLDYSSSYDDIGKNIGDDLAEGKPTLPLIRVMTTGSPEHAQTVRDAIMEGGRGHIEAVMRAIESTDAIAYTAKIARNEANKALAMLTELPDSKYKDALSALAEFSISRTF
jgi:octaprenyl-diphosphate synthase